MSLFDPFDIMSMDVGPMAAPEPVEKPVEKKPCTCGLCAARRR